MRATVENKGKKGEKGLYHAHGLWGFVADQKNECE